MIARVKWGSLVGGLVALAAVGCGDDGAASPPDAAARDGGSADAEVLLVTAPAPVSMAPCPPGWIEERPRPTVTTCAPWPAGGALDCGVDEAHFPGTDGCARVGTACPAGDFAEPPAGASALLYVRAGASGGDGSEAAPFARIAEATARARAGTVILVGRGRYAEEVRLPSGVSLLGACVAETILTYATASTTAGVVVPTGTGAVVQNVRVADAARPATFAAGGADVTFRDVVVDNVEFGGLIAFGGGRVVGERVVVRNTRSRTTNQAGGAALVVLDSSAEIHGAAFEHNRDLGSTVDGAGASLVLEDVVIRDTAPRDTDRTRGRGLEVSAGATAELRRVLVEQSHEVGLWIHVANAEVTAETLVVRDTTVRESDGLTGMGITVSETGYLGGSGISVSRSVGAGVILVQGTLSAQNLVIAETDSERDGYFGRGLVVQEEGTVELGRVAVLDNRDVGIFAGGERVSLVVSDLLVSNTLGDRADGMHGRAIEVLELATVAVQRAIIEGNREVALAATTPGASLTATDIVVRGTLPRDCAATTGCEPTGVGIGAYNGGVVDVSRFLLMGSNLCGAQVAASGSLDLADGAVTDNPIGACVQIDGYDIARLSRNVRYHNDTDLSATTLPVPSASAGDLLRP